MTESVTRDQQKEDIPESQTSALMCARTGHQKIKNETWKTKKQKTEITKNENRKIKKRKTEIKNQEKKK